MRSVVVGVLLVCAIMLALCMMFSPRPERASRPPTPRETVFVVVPRAVDVRSIFAAARFPMRVFVGVGTPCEYHANTRFLSVDSRMGDSVRRQQVFDELYRNESVVLFVQPQVQFLPGWDVKLLRSFVGSVTCVSQWPCDGEQHATTFPYFRCFTGSWPTFAGAPACRAQEPFPIPLVTWQCVAVKRLFGAAHLQQPPSHLQQPPLQCVSRTEDDLLLSFALCNRGCTTFAPGSSIVCLPSAVKPDRQYEAELRETRMHRAATQHILEHVLLDKEWQQGDKPDYVHWLQKQVQARDFFAWLGIDLMTRSAKADIRLGLTCDSASADILPRYGSIAVYHELRQALDESG